MDTNNQELVSQSCVDIWRELYARRRMLRQAPYWAWDREGNRIPITAIVETVRPKSILDYGSGNGRAADILRNRDINFQLQVTCYDPAWPGASQVPYQPHDLVICYNVLNNVEADYLDRVCAHIESLVARDLIIAIIMPAERASEDTANYWISRFPNLGASYWTISPGEEGPNVTGKMMQFKTVFIWLYREPEEVVVVPPRVRLKKNKPV